VAGDWKKGVEPLEGDLDRARRPKGDCHSLIGVGGSYTLVTSLTQSPATFPNITSNTRARPLNSACQGAKWRNGEAWSRTRVLAADPPEAATPACGPQINESYSTCDTLQLKSHALAAASRSATFFQLMMFHTALR
jgi:hypothetical protein